MVKKDDLTIPVNKEILNLNHTAQILYFSYHIISTIRVLFVAYLKTSAHTGIKVNKFIALPGCNTPHCELGSSDFGTNIF
jgi:hypothetical protein